MTSLSEVLQGEDVKLFIFLEDKKLTISSSVGMVRAAITLNGSGTAQEIVENPEKLQKTKQFKTMSSLGFRSVDQFHMTYVRDGVKIRFYYGRVAEIFLNGIPVKSAVVPL